jgi:hypothetical protein
MNKKIFTYCTTLLQLTQNSQIFMAGIRIIRKIMEFGALRGFKGSKGDCAGAVSTRVCQRAGMMAVHKLLYDQYEVCNKVVFQNTPTRGDGCPTAGILEDLSKL